MPKIRILRFGLANDREFACMIPPVKVIALEWNSPMFIKVLAELSAQLGWETVYCVSKNTQDLLKQHFPAAVYHDTHEARYGRPAAEFANLPWVSLDQPAAESLGYAQVMAFKQMDRLAIMDGFPLHERSLHFHRLVSYWSQVLDRLQPDLLLMPTSPHAIYDYIAYQLARRRGIRAVMFEYVTTEGWLMAIDRFEDGLPPLTAAYRKLLASPPSGRVALSDRMEGYLCRLQDKYSVAMPQATREFLERAEGIRVQREAEESAHKHATTSEPSNETGIVDGILRVFGVQRVLKSEVAEQKLPPLSTDGHYGGRFYSDTELPEQIARDAAVHRRRHQEAIRRRYDEIAVSPDLGQPYIYVPLHLQPERSTNPIGGVFDEQYVMVGMISSVLPPGWQIYVKEHPSQFAPQFASERGRWMNLYEALTLIPAVTLVTRQTVSFDLIDNARAVATVTGTSSWEAIVRGVPTLVFGEPWYKGCPGSYTVRTADDCRQALTRIIAGERPDTEATRLFLKAAEDNSFIGYICSDDEPIANIDEATNVQRMVRAIADSYAAGADRQGT
jgi:hypothetical protein